MVAVEENKSTDGFSASTLARAARASWELLLDFVYPPRCGGCDRRGTLFCDRCLASIRPVEVPRSVERIDELVCAGVFDGVLRSAIHKFKYEGDAPLARPLASLLHEALAADGLLTRLGERPVLVPVPLHTARHKSRGYNQAELLVRELAKLGGWQVGHGLLRARQTRTQVGLSAKERVENVAGAFEWRGESVPASVLLVDDVCTTGSTLSECAAALRAAGVGHVHAATVAKAADHTADAYPWKAA